MRQHTKIEWEILEAEEDEWAEVTLATATREPKPLRRQRLATVFGVSVLLVALVALAGYRLWQEAEAGIAATEQHIGTLVEVETLRRQQSEPASGLTADVQSVDIMGSAAMVRVVMTQTSLLGEVCSRTELLFFRRSSVGWTRTGPIAAVWGKKEEIETSTLHFDFHELDRPYVEAVAEPADTFHRALREFLGLPPLTVTERVIITVVPKYVPPGILADGTLENSSPFLLYCGGKCDRMTMSWNGLHTQLVSRNLEESRVRYHVRPIWEPMYTALASWLVDHADELPANLPDGTRIGQDSNPLRRIYLLRNPVAGSAVDHYPGYAEYLGRDAAYAAYSFYDSLMADRGPTAIPALLAAFGTEDNWPDVVQTAFGVSVVDLQAEWDGYVQTMWKKAPGSAAAAGSSIR